MTQRLKGVTVTFNQDIREDDAECIINAIKMVKGVIHVAPVETNVDDYMNRMKVQTELEKVIWNALDKYRKGDANVKT